jgi:F-type H+-transporting ATPase subunit k
MVAKYNVLGRQVGSHVVSCAVEAPTLALSIASGFPLNLYMLIVLCSQLAMMTLGTLFGTSFYFASGSKKPAATPPINAASSDEADFIKYAETTNQSSDTLYFRANQLSQEVHGERRSGG